MEFFMVVELITCHYNLCMFEKEKPNDVHPGWKENKGKIPTHKLDAFFFCLFFAVKQQFRSSSLTCRISSEKNTDSM